jgi:hypothetical protein
MFLLHETEKYERNKIKLYDYLFGCNAKNKEIDRYAT